MDLYCDALRAAGFSEMAYADDLSGSCAYPTHLSENFLLDDLRSAQRQLHIWGEANGVRFDAGKESFHILSRSGPTYSENFKMLGIRFDPKLNMQSAIHALLLATGNCSLFYGQHVFILMQKLLLPRSSA